MPHRFRGGGGAFHLHKSRCWVECNQAKERYKSPGKNTSRMERKDLPSLQAVLLTAKCLLILVFPCLPLAPPQPCGPRRPAGLFHQLPQPQGARPRLRPLQGKPGGAEWRLPSAGGGTRSGRGPGWAGP